MQAPLPKTYPEYLDVDVQRMASLTELPNQPVNLAPTNTFHGTQIQQLRVKTTPPVVDSAAPLNVTRRALGNGQFQYRVQFVTPTPAQDPTYQTTSVLVNNPSLGTSRLAAVNGEGPIIFTSGQSTAPTQLSLQQNNASASSDIGLGEGLSRALISQ